MCSIKSIKVLIEHLIKKLPRKGERIPSPNFITCHGRYATKHRICYTISIESERIEGVKSEGNILGRESIAINI